MAVQVLLLLSSFSSYSAAGDNSHHLKDQLHAAYREKDEPHRTIENLKHQFTQSL
jgi:hypothetical protein